MLVAIFADNLGNHEVALQYFSHLLDGVAEYHLVGHLYREGVQGHRLEVSHTALGSSFLLALVDTQRIP